MDAEDVEIAAGAQAFGDGTHPTTRGVLKALSMIDPALFSPDIACDMGAGSGILSFAILHHFGCPVVAVDVMPSAVAAIEENARRNGVEGRIRAVVADGFNHPDIRAAGPYGLVVMNILAEPLLALAAEAEAQLAAGGVLILSGMLVWQEPQLQAAYEALGLERTSRIAIGDWVTLIYQKA